MLREHPGANAIQLRFEILAVSMARHCINKWIRHSGRASYNSGSQLTLYVAPGVRVSYSSTKHSISVFISNSLKVGDEGGETDFISTAYIVDKTIEVAVLN